MFTTFSALVAAALLSAAPVAAPAPTPAAAAPQAYSGLGAGSVPKEIVEKYGPKPFDPELTRKVQMMMDVRAPGMGLPSPRGDRLFFSWNVTGTRQVWRLEGADRFPIQMTGGEDNTNVVDITPDGKTLVVQRDRKGEENPGLYLLDAGGGPLVAVQHLEKVQTHFQFLTADGAWLYFRANDQKPDAYALYRWDLKSNKREAVFAEPGLWAIDTTGPTGGCCCARTSAACRPSTSSWPPAPPRRPRSSARASASSTRRSTRPRRASSWS
ncbi:MAG TPA: hypothetical protein VGK67_37325 [Myxococcales bacterium]|jgi:hypothetical protein